MGEIRFPGLEEVVAALAERLPSSLQSLFDESFVRSSFLYDEFIYRLALRVAREIGIDGDPAEPESVDAAIHRAGLDPARARVPVAWLLRALALHVSRAPVPDYRPRPQAAAAGERSGDHDEPAVPNQLDPAELRRAQEAHDSSWLPSYRVAQVAAEAYPAFLRGEASGEEMLFRPGHLDLWTDYFSNRNGLYAVNNRIAALASETWAPWGRGGSGGDRRGGAVVLELGGGLGSGALAILERFEQAGRLGEIARYQFTELMPAFLRRGRSALMQRFGGWGALTFGRLDMNRPFPTQGVEEASVCLVGAVNTLHVAHDLLFTLGEINRSLRPGGMLLLSECVRPFPAQPVYVEFVFNLLEAFRSPRLDPRHRPNGGFLTPEQWNGALGAAGFEGIRWLPDIALLRDGLPAFYVAAVVAFRPR